MSGVPPRCCTKLKRMPRMPARVQLLEIAVREAARRCSRRRDTAAALRDRVEDHGVVDAVATRVDEHGAREPERFLQLHEALERRVRRRVAAIGAYGYLSPGPKMWQCASQAPGGGRYFGTRVFGSGAMQTGSQPKALLQPVERLHRRQHLRDAGVRLALLAGSPRRTRDPAARCRSSTRRRRTVDLVGPCRRTARRSARCTCRCRRCSGRTCPAGRRC